MSLGNTVLFGMMSEKMSWLGQRQRVLSQNVANADTPSYHAKDLAPLKFTDAMARQDRSVSLTVSSPMHVALPGSTARFEESDADKVYETSVDGNSVVLEEQMMKLTETTEDYNLATGIYRKYMALHKAALGSGGGN